MRTLRNTAPVAAVFGFAAFALAPGEVFAQDLVLSPGLLFTATVGGPDARWGFGVECSLLQQLNRQGYTAPAVGGVAQAQFFTDGTFRVALAAEGAVWFGGLELGLAFRTGNARRDAAFALHAAGYLSAGYAWGAYNANITLGRPAGVPRVEHLIHFGPKFPFIGSPQRDWSRDDTPIVGYEFEPYRLNLGSGRPLCDARGPCLAPLRTRDDAWVAPLADAPTAEGLAPRARAALATHWRRDARFEHASVASFARLTLELLALGAPPTLLLGAQRAAMDEVSHARLCLGVARALDGHALSPSALPAAAEAGRAADLRTLAVEALREGCLGEGISAARCAAAADRALPAVRDVLAQIAAEEAAHAELAWSVLAWCVATGGEVIADAVRAELRAWRATPRTAEPRDGLDHADREAWGRLHPRRAEAIAHSVTAGVRRRWAGLDAGAAPKAA